MQVQCQSREDRARPDEIEPGRQAGEVGQESRVSKGQQQVAHRADPQTGQRGFHHVHKGIVRAPEV